MVELIFASLDFAGVFFFALSGGILAARKTLDPFGAVIVGSAAGMGGGTLRDVMLGALPVFWVDAPVYLVVAGAGALAGYYGSAALRGETGARRRALAWTDAAGLSVFTVIGAQAGLAVNVHWSIAMLTGVMSAAFGGLIRDVIVNEVPLVLREEIYALAAMAGAAAYVGALTAGWSAEIAGPGAALLVFAIRGAAMIFNWSLPPVSKQD